MTLTSTDFGDFATAYAAHQPPSFKGEATEQAADALEALARDPDEGGFDDERGFGDEDEELPLGEGDGYEVHGDEGGDIIEEDDIIEEEDLEDGLPTGVAQRIDDLVDDLLRPASRGLAEGQERECVVAKVSRSRARVTLDGSVATLDLRDYSWDWLPDLREHLAPSEQLKVQLLSLSKGRARTKVGVKRLMDEPAGDRDLPLGACVQGFVLQADEKGAIVQLPSGFNAYLPLSEVSWVLPRGAGASALLHRGMEIPVVVVRPAQWTYSAIVSHRRSLPNPWPRLLSRYTCGRRVVGTVVEHVRHGLVVEMEPGIEGFLGLGDIHWAQPAPPVSLRYPVGERLVATVLRQRPLTWGPKVDLGIRQLVPDPWRRIPREYPVGRMVPGSVYRVHEDGLTVRLPAGIEVWIARDRIRPASADPLQEFVIGQRIAPQVVRVDPLACELSLLVTVR